MPVSNMNFGQNDYVYVNIWTGAAAFSQHFAPTLRKNDEGLQFRRGFAQFRTGFRRAKLVPEFRTTHCQ